MPVGFHEEDAYRHAVLPQKQFAAPRISLTFRSPDLSAGGPWTPEHTPRVWDCHAGKDYPSDAIYVGCCVRDRQGGIIREGTIFGNGKNPLVSHRPWAAGKESDPPSKNAKAFRAYAEQKMLDHAFRQEAEALRGKDLLCWCEQDGPKRTKFCHARVWLDLINSPAIVYNSRSPGSEGSFGSGSVESGSVESQLIAPPVGYPRNTRWFHHNREFVSWCKSYVGAKFHAVLSDPPYGLEFMGKEWDNPNQQPHFFPTQHEKHAADNNLKLLDNLPRFCHSNKINFQTLVRSWGEALLPLLYPGALVLMFGGTRMFHRLAAGMEDAGYELWDTMMWLYGSGFPKAYNVAAGIEGKVRTGSANWNEWKDLGGKKYEQKPGYVKLQDEQGYRGDYSAAKSGVVDLTVAEAKAWEGHKSPQLKPAWEPCLCFRAPRCGKSYVDLALEAGSGCLNIGGSRIGERYPANLMLDEDSAPMLEQHRFFYCAKASRSERDAGIVGKKRQRDLSRRPDQPSMNGGEGNAYNRGCKPVLNSHPCVKPIDLCRYLATLLLPPSTIKHRRLLVPFCGSGSEMIGGIQAGWDEVVGIEMDKHYAKIAEQRCKHWAEQLPTAEGWKYA